MVIVIIVCLNLVQIFSSKQFKLTSIEGEFVYDIYGFIIFNLELSISVSSTFNISTNLFCAILLLKQIIQIISRKFSTNCNIDFMLKKELFEISIIIAILLNLKWIDSFMIFILLQYVLIQIRNNAFTHILLKDQNYVDSLLQCRLLVYY